MDGALPDHVAPPLIDELQDLLKAHGTALVRERIAQFVRELKAKE